MRVVYEAALFPGSGGGHRHFVGLGSALVRTGAEVTFVLPAGSQADMTGRGGRLTTLRVRSRGRVAKNLEYELRRALLVLRWLVTGRRVDVWISRHTLIGVGLPLARLVARTVVLEVNGPIREELLANRGSRLLATVADAAFSVQMAASHLVAPVTPGLRDYIARRTGPGAGRPVRVIANGADPVTVVAGDREPDRVLFAGALTPWYDVPLMLRAFARVAPGRPRARLVVCGDGLGLPGARDLAHELGIGDAVEFRGWVSGEEVARELARASVGMLPLQRKTAGIDVVGSPLKLYEYAAAGLRIVGTQLDGVVNSPLSDRVHAFVPGDLDSCVAALEEALDAPPTQDGAGLWSWDARADELLEALP